MRWGIGDGAAIVKSLGEVARALKETGTSATVAKPATSSGEAENFSTCCAVRGAGRNPQPHVCWSWWTEVAAVLAVGVESVGA